MPPTSNFGQDITNTANGGGNGNDEGNGLPTIAQIERMGGQMTLPRVAGKGVIRVVRRCEDAKENNKLGKFSLFIYHKSLYIVNVCCMGIWLLLVGHSSEWWGIMY